MRQLTEKNTFDWSRSVDLNIKARGIGALLMNSGRRLPNLNVIKTSSKVEWPLQQYQSGSRYLSRKVWAN